MNKNYIYITAAAVVLAIAIALFFIGKKTTKAKNE